MLAKIGSCTSRALLEKSVAPITELLQDDGVRKLLSGMVHFDEAPDRVPLYASMYLESLGFLLSSHSGVPKPLHSIM